MDIYTLISENLTGLGGPMGTERTWENWRKNFIDPDVAKMVAQKDYESQSKSAPIKWKKTKKGWTSGDLSFVMYSIEKLVIYEEEDVIPQPLDDTGILANLPKLVTACKGYVEFVYSDDYHEDNDHDHFIFEAAMQAIYGKGIFKELNSKMR